MDSETYLAEGILATWQTSNRVTIYLIEHLPQEIWQRKVPGYKQKTIQMLGGHLHNTRCMWIKNVGEKFDIEPPEHVDRYRVSQQELIEALSISSGQILKLLGKAVEYGDTLTGFSLDVVHFLNYLVAHEAHHRGQIILVARQVGHKLPREVTYGVWKWSNRSKEI